MGLRFVSAHPNDLADDRVVEIAIHTESVIEFFSAIEELLQLFIKLRDRKRLVGTKLPLCTFDAGTTPVPDLSFRIARAHKQRVAIALRQI